MPVLDRGRLLFILFFTLSVMLAGGVGHIGGGVLAGTAGPLGLVIFVLALAGLSLSLLVLARILYLATRASSTSPPRRE